jgi:hypothetical protein
MEVVTSGVPALSYLSESGRQRPSEVRLLIREFGI